MGLATGLFFGGLALKVFGQIRAGQAAEARAEGEEAMARHNQAVQEQAAKAAEIKTKFDQMRLAKRGRRVLGTLRAGLGGSGAVPSEGAPEDIVIEQAEELALESALIGHEGQVTAARERSRGDIFGMKADLAGLRADIAGPTALIGAGTTLLKGFGTARGLAMV